MEIANHYHALLLLMTFLPLVTGFFLLFLNRNIARSAALLGTVATLLASLLLVAQTGTFAFPADFTSGVNVAWIPGLNIRLLMGMDGLSGAMVLLTNVLFVMAVACSWTAIENRQKEFYLFLLMLQTGVLGTFLSLDLILFYIFWELMLIPLYFMIGIFGSGRRIYATMKFFLYTFAGSVFMLIGILTLYFQARTIGGIGSFALPELLKITPQIDPVLQGWIYLSFLLAFAIKVPLFPLHTWLPDAHTEAPTAGSVILAGVLLKTGVYGLMRIAIPLFPGPAQYYAPIVCILAVIAIIYGALTAFHQEDMKRLIAYSSVSHMGFIVLGLYAFKEISITGASLQMINHGISTGGLFLCVGYLYERRHTRDMKQFGGIAYRMKVYTVLTGIMVLSSVGLPGLNGFVGEFPILVGTFLTNHWWAVFASTGVILAACYLLKMMQMTFFGPLDNEENKKLTDLNWGREAMTLIVLAIFALWIGVYPKPFTDALTPASRTIVNAIETSRGEIGALASAKPLLSRK